MLIYGSFPLKQQPLTQQSSTWKNHEIRKVYFSTLRSCFLFLNIRTLCWSVLSVLLWYEFTTEFLCCQTCCFVTSWASIAIFAATKQDLCFSVLDVIWLCKVLNKCICPFVDFFAILHQDLDLSQSTASHRQRNIVLLCIRCSLWLPCWRSVDYLRVWCECLQRILPVSLLLPSCSVVIRS